MSVPLGRWRQAGERSGGGARGAHLRAIACSIVVAIRGLALLVLAAALLSGCSSGGGEAPEATIGDPASNTKVAVTVHSVKVLRTITLEDGIPSTVRDKGVYVLVDMTVKNLQDTADVVDLRTLWVKVDDKYYSADEGMADDNEAPRDFRPIRTGRLGPGKKVRGMVLFLVPRGSLQSVTYRGEPEDLVIGLGGMKATATAAKKVPRIGQTAKAGGLAMTVHSVSYPTHLTHGLWTTSAKSGDRLVMIDVTLRNLDRKPSYHIDPLSVRVIDAKGKGWGSYDRSENGLPESVQLPLKRLQPGSQVRGTVVISVPAKAKLRRVRYEVGVLGPPLEVRLGK